MAACQRNVYQCSDCKAFFDTFTGVASHQCFTAAVDNNANTVTVDLNEALVSEADIIGQNVGETARPTSIWTVEKTKVLLDNYKENRQKLESPVFKKKKVWQEITESVNKETDSHFTVTQVEGRWKTVLAAYRKHKDNQNKTGAGRSKFDYLTEMDDIMGDNHSTTPSFLMSSIPVTKRPATPTSNNGESDDELHVTGSASKRNGNKKQKCSESGAAKMISFLETYTKSETEREVAANLRAEERHRENINVLKSLVDVLKGLSKSD